MAELTPQQLSDRRLVGDGSRAQNIRFLNAVDQEIPPGKFVHTMMNNCATHKHPKVKAWSPRHPLWTFHFTPTLTFWLNTVETVFSILIHKRIRRGVFNSVVDRQAAFDRHH